MSNAQKVIPDRVQNWWREYRAAAKQATRERMGEMAQPDVYGHGVAEAEQRSKQEGASECQEDVLSLLVCHADTLPRLGHAACASIRYPQKLHLSPRPSDGRCHAQDCQGAPIMGLADWQEEGSAVIRGRFTSTGIDPLPQLHGHTQ